MTREPTPAPGRADGPSSGSPMKRFRNISAKRTRNRHSYVSSRRHGSMRFITIGLLVALAVTAFAHHSFDAEYDSNKIATLSGVVTKVDWVNPHAFISFVMKDD